MYLVGIMRVVNTIDLFELPEAILEIKMPLCFSIIAHLVFLQTS